MLIIDEKYKIKDEDEELDDEEERNYPPRNGRHRNEQKPKKHSCAKASSCFFIFLILIVVIIYFSLKFLIGPVIMAVDKLPNDFPSELVLYNIDQAKIKTQNPDEKEKLSNILNNVPNWLGSLFINSISTNKTQIIEKTADGVSSQKLSIDGFKNYLQNPNLQDVKTVSASWNEINRKKEDLSEFYRKQLVNKDFEFKEEIQDYDINLSFWKDNIFGIIKIADSLTNDSSSKADITVNYK